MAEPVPPTSPTPVQYKLGTAVEPPVNLGGTTVNVSGADPWALRDAVLAAVNTNGTHKGNTLVVPAGATFYGFSMPVATTGWTRIITDGTLPSGDAGQRRAGASHAGQMFKVVSPDQGPTNPSASALYFPTSTQGWIFTGMEATHAGPAAAAVIIWTESSQAYSRFIFDRCYVHPGPGQTVLNHALFIAMVDDWQCWDSTIIAIVQQGLSGDSQAIFQRGGTRAHIEHNELQGGDENLMLGDQGSSARPTDVSIFRNYLLKPLSWFELLEDGSANPAYGGVKYSLKNHFEIKLAKNVAFVGNTCENLWRANQDHSITMCSGFHPGSEWDTADILIKSNTVTRVQARFVSTTRGMGGGDPWGNPVARVAVVNNLALGLRGSFFFANWGGTDLRIEHNTAVPMDAYWPGIWPVPKSVSLDIADPGFPNFVMRRNAIGINSQQWPPPFWEENGLGAITATMLGTYAPGYDWSENAIYGNPNQDVFATVGSDLGFVRYASAATAGVNTTTGVLASNSPLKVGQAGYFATDGQDVGVNFTTLADDQGGTTPPVPQPWFTWQQTVETLSVVFTNATQNATGATWLWSFGDQTTSTQESPTHPYMTANESPGYTVTLAATVDGQTYTVVRTVPVTGTAPVALRHTMFRASSRKVVA